MEWTELIDHVARGFEAAGVAILVIGSLSIAVRTAIEAADGRASYTVLRRRLGRTLLLGLEVLVAADIIKTVAIDPTLKSVTALGVLVLVRTVLSISLDMEIDGVAPWRKAALKAQSE